MSSKRKWDQPGEDGAPDVKNEDTPEPSSEKPAEDVKPDVKPEGRIDAATAAAAIAAKIAAQFAAGNLKDADAFYKDIDINDARNRYLVTKGTTQQEIHDATGANISTKGTWYPDRSKATERDPPLYIHITAATQEALDKGVALINEQLALDLGSLVEDKKDRMRERRKWPEEKLPVGLESVRNFHIRAKVVGPQGQFVKFIQQETGTRVQVKGLGSAFIEPDTGKESEEPLFIHITGPDEAQVARAKLLAEDLLLVVRSEHSKALAMAGGGPDMGYGGYGGGYGGGAPPPPPGEQPPPPPGGDPSQQAGPDPNNPEAFAAYWSAYGYDVNSDQFKEWMASQQQAYAAYYAQAYAAQPAPPPSQPDQPPPPPPGM
ncbi:hypothetical protein CYLTODRAFT_436753 [Cylindrobasidium torrendii FP15055 ss-10]|uniref:K Homology domain-containing protein n=1 Tax=Cylindrobasidium torrendii FP15055 ss-10 TaxID=1314674 RepID=A0A0D7BC04_9AGAR|nr:hypothetical protein CYLTODRAFT_436753 [Cylindrobasidium torrendii FP15055 ss-10]